MKICVYAIAKNEEQFVDRWMDSMREADWVCVLDTGSTDRTVEKLADRGAVVRQEAVSPWRFDAARNRSMELIPPDTDICVCTDLDEVFRPAGGSCWRMPGSREQNSSGTPISGASAPAERRALRSCRRKSRPRRVPLASSGT